MQLRERSLEFLNSFVLFCSLQWWCIHDVWIALNCRYCHRISRNSSLFVVPDWSELLGHNSLDDAWASVGPPTTCCLGHSAEQQRCDLLLVNQVLEAQLAIRTANASKGFQRYFEIAGILAQGFFGNNKSVVLVALSSQRCFRWRSLCQVVPLRRFHCVSHSWKDGSVVTWGNPEAGGDSAEVCVCVCVCVSRQSWCICCDPGRRFCFCYLEPTNANQTAVVTALQSNISWWICSLGGCPKIQIIFVWKTIIPTKCLTWERLLLVAIVPHVPHAQAQVFGALHLCRWWWWQGVAGEMTPTSWRSKTLIPVKFWKVERCRVHSLCSCSAKGP